MKRLVRIVVLIFLTLSPASSGALEKSLVGVIYGETARTTEGISLEPSLIRDAMTATKNFQDVTGTITMDRNGDLVKPISFFRFEGGNSVLVKTVRP